MPYKTKFREIKVPQTMQEMQALGQDANSLRSFGAAEYKQFIESGCTPQGMQIIITAISGAYDKVIRPLAESGEIEVNLARERQAQTYIMEGFARAAGQMGDRGVVEYISQALERLKSE